MLQKNAAGLFNHQRMALTVMAIPHDKFRLHIIHMGAGVFYDTVITRRRGVFAVDGNNRMSGECFAYHAGFCASGFHGYDSFLGKAGHTHVSKSVARLGG